MTKALPYLLLILMLASCMRGDKYILRHAADTVPCNPKDTTYLSCSQCGGNVYQGRIEPTSVPDLVRNRDIERASFFMFFDSGCSSFPRTMPPYLKKVLEYDTIVPVLILVDEYFSLPIARSRLTAWGWTGPVYALDQGHYGCYRYFASNRLEQVLREFNINETESYFKTTALEVLVNTSGQVIGYSNRQDLPVELRGQNLPSY